MSANGVAVKSQEKLVESGLEKAHSLEDVLLDFFAEREEPVHTGILSVLTRQHHLQIGKPGTGKSGLSMAICQAIQNALFYDDIMRPTMDEDQIWGPVSISAYQDDRYERLFASYAADAHIVFLTEIYRASEAILGGLLRWMNERLVRNGAQMVKTPLISIFADTNFLYEGLALDALHSRFTFRHYTDYVQERENWDRMIDANVAGDRPDVERIGLTLNEAQAVQDALPTVPVTQNAKDILWAIRCNLKNDVGIELDDRRAIWALKQIVRAEALYQGHDEMQPEDFDILQHVLWDDPSEAEAVSRAVLKVSNPVAEKANRYVDQAQKALKELVDFENQHPGDSRSVADKAFQVNDEFKELVTTLEGEINGSSGPTQRSFQKALHKVEEMQRQVLKKTGFGNLVHA